MTPFIQKLIKLIDEDTEAFNDVMKAFKMPKETEEQKKKRSMAIQEGYKKATSIPLDTSKTCEEILDLSMIVAKKGNQNSITDAAVSALMARAGVESAILNVRINLGSIKDTLFVNQISSDLNSLQKNAEEKTNMIMKIVEKAL